MGKMKLAIVSTHPIQYNAPLFKLLAESGSVTPRVFYTWSQSRKEVADKDFKQRIQWDIPLLDGYDYEFVENTSPDPGTHHFRGIQNPDLNQRIKNWGADALLVYGWNFKSHLKSMRHFKGKIPVFFRGDSTLIDDKTGLKQVLRRIWLRWVYQHIDHAFYVGTNNRDYFLKHGLRPQQLIFAPHAIDNNRFFDKTGKYREKAKEWRQSMDIPGEKTLVAFVGKMIPKKDPMILLRAALDKDLANLEFLFTGNGMLEKALKKKAKGHSNIHFMDFRNQSEMPVLYYTSDVVCLPSKGPGETWGLVINEAMSCERAVIASDKVGCSPDLIIDGENGYTFRSGNQEALTEILKKFAENSRLSGKMGKRSRELILDWSYEHVVKAVERGLEKVVKR